MGRLPSFAGVRNRRARQHARKGSVLRDAGVTKATQERYYNAVSLLCKTVQEASDMEDLDDQVGDWIELQFRRGAPLNVVADALSGLHFCIQQDRYDMACLLALGFHCFLRTGGLLAIRPCDLLLRDQKGIVHLPHSKGVTRHNVRESVTIESPTVSVLLEELLWRKKRAGEFRVPIWTASGTKFRKEFQGLNETFKVSHLQFRGYSLRRGGATAYFRKYGLMEKTLLRGRWASIAVARLYLCDALAQLPSLVASSKPKG